MCLTRGVILAQATLPAKSSGGLLAPNSPTKPVPTKAATLGRENCHMASTASELSVSLTSVGVFENHLIYLYELLALNNICVDLEGEK